MSFPGIRVSHVDIVDAVTLGQYIGPWAIYEQWAADFVTMHRNIDLATHGGVIRAQDGIDVVEGVAVLSIDGMMTKRGSSFSDSGGTVRLRQQLRQAQRDPVVSAVFLVIDSPGGTLAGTKELADEVAATVSGGKPVVSFVEDLGASAAYYVASQSTKVFANEPAMVGSIGTYMVMVDSSQAAEDIGLQVHVIKAGEFKGAGLGGTKVTDEHIEHFQGLIDAANEAFLSAVKTGRNLTDNALLGVANGKVFTTADAIRLGLIDGVETYDSAFNFTKGLFMSSEPTKPEVASLKELRSALVGADADFIISQLDADATLQEAQEAWIIEQSDRLARAQEEATAANAVAVGPEPLGEDVVTNTRVGTVKDEWHQLINAKIKGGMDRAKAVKAVNRENPGLREELVAESNS